MAATRRGVRRRPATASIGAEGSTVQVWRHRAHERATSDDPEPQVRTLEDRHSMVTGSFSRCRRATSRGGAVLRHSETGATPGTELATRCRGRQRWTRRQRC